MRLHSPACPHCGSECPESLFCRVFQCPVCKKAVRFPVGYSVLLRLVRLFFFAIVAYYLGAHGTALIFAPFVIPLPLDQLKLGSTAFPLRVALSLGGAYLLGFRGIPFIIAFALMMIPIDGFFDILSKAIPVGRLRESRLAKCPNCQSDLPENEIDFRSIAICRSCGLRVALSTRAVRYKALVDTVSTAILLFFIWAILFSHQQYLSDAVLLIWLLYMDLSLSFVGVFEREAKALSVRERYSISLFRR
ncbi:MAG TPA: hypothetical protein VJN90_03420 [Candidatus Acidoferrales bacterium]|nr:hypothetical protein [Candidatus Acidoferrales bacterium]